MGPRMPARSLVAPSLAALLALSVSACKGGSQAPRQRPPPAVTVAPVEVRDVPVEIRAPVDLRPLFQADVGAKTLGYLGAVLVDRGDVVRKGQLLAVVRPSDLPDQLEAARVAFENAKANKARAEALAPSGVVSQQELQNTQSAFATAQANLAAVSTRYGETRIESPIDGVVSQRRLDPGVLVGPNAGTGSILTVQRNDVLRVFIPVNEKDAGSVRIGQSASVAFDALPGRRYAGKVVRLSPAFDPVTRTLDAEVHLVNPGELRAGMYGRGTIVTAVHPGAVVVPVGAVQLSDGKAFAYLVQGDKVRRVEIRIGVDGGNWYEVVEGLKAGDEIVTAGTDTLADGAAIRAVRGVDPFTGKATAAASPPAVPPAPGGPAAGAPPTR
jgi:membrane fusion protein, multidrug efflux system